jgi:hypothetical protein
MTGFLVGLVVGVLVCWAVLHFTEWHFERHNP